MSGGEGSGSAFVLSLYGDKGTLPSVTLVAVRGTKLPSPQIQQPWLCAYAVHT